MEGKNFKEKIYIYFLSELFFWGYFAMFNAFFKYNKKSLSNYSGPAIYAIWHGRQYAIISTEKEKRAITNILVSPSNDGEIITRNLLKAGFSVIRGSVKRKGAEAALKCIKALKNGESLFYNVDGPKGPIYKVKKGIVKIAQKSGVPIVPMVPETKYKICFSSWDNYNLPLFFGRPTVITGEPIYIPKDITKEQEEEYRLKVENALFELDKIVQANI